MKRYALFFIALLAFFPALILAEEAYDPDPYVKLLNINDPAYPDSIRVEELVPKITAHLSYYGIRLIIVPQNGNVARDVSTGQLVYAFLFTAEKLKDDFLIEIASGKFLDVHIDMTKEHEKIEARAIPDARIS